MCTIIQTAPDYRQTPWTGNDSSLLLSFVILLFAALGKAVLQILTAAS